MIPKIIHYCWFGEDEMPDLAKKCIESWLKCMPNWKYKLWNEDNFDVNTTLYTREAYDANKYAFVSDYVRLKALYEEGGIYFDTDVEVYKSFETLIFQKAFAGFEGSKHLPVGTCIMASEPRGEWITEQYESYQDKHFIKENGSFDLTTNVSDMTGRMVKNGLVQNGKEQNYKDCHIYPVEYFSPRYTTGEYIRTENTYCDHKGIGSWMEKNDRCKKAILSICGDKMRVQMIKIKRIILG